MESQGNMSRTAILKKNRRTWTPKEEQALMTCLLDMNGSTWKQDGQFKGGYLKQLELEMKQKIPGGNLKASPHIESKVRDWKKLYHLIASLVGLSGFGWSTNGNMVTNDEEDVWNHYIKKDPDYKKIRTKSFPFYPDWCKIWGNDRATGEFSETPNDAANELNKSRVGTGTEIHDLDPPDVGLDDIESTVPLPQNKLLKTKGAEPRKRKRVNEEIGMEMNKNLESGSKGINRIADSLHVISGRIGHDKDQSDKRAHLEELVEPLGFSLHEGLNVIQQLALKPFLLDAFCGLRSEESRIEFARMILYNNV